MKSLLFILIAFSVVFSLDKYTIPFSASDTMTAAQFNSNNDTTKYYMDKIIDTINKNVPRYTQNTNTHDLIMPFLRIDTLRSNTDIDSISGRPFIDTIDTRYIDSDTSHSTVASADTGKFSYITIGGSELTYTSGTFLCSLVDYTAASALNVYKTATAYYSKIGEFVTMEFDSMTMTAAVYGSAGIHIMGIPASLLPRTGTIFGSIAGKFYTDGSENDVVAYIISGTGAIAGNVTHEMNYVGGNFGDVTKKGWDTPISFSYSRNVQ